MEVIRRWSPRFDLAIPVPTRALEHGLSHSDSMVSKTDGMRRTVSVLLIAAAMPTIGWNVQAQTKESPVLDYPAPKKTKTVLPNYPSTAHSGSMVLELTIRPDGKVDAVVIRNPWDSRDVSVAPRKRAASEALPRPNCVSQFGDRGSPPRKVGDYKPDTSDLAGIETHAGVLIFEITVLPSGRVTDVRLVKRVDPRAPWPALVERWRSAIAQWRYEPAIVDGKPIAACLTVMVNIHVT